MENRITRVVINRPLLDQSSREQHSPHSAYGVQKQGKLFLSHSSKDKEFVQFLYKELCSHYHYAITFSAAEAVSRENILEEARGSELGVLVLTNDFFVHTPNCMLELEAFVAGKVQLLPLFFRMSVSEFIEKRRRRLWERQWREWSDVDKKVIKKWRHALKLLSTLNIGLEYHTTATDVDYVKKIVKEVTRIIPPAISFCHEEVFGKDRLCEIVNKMYEKCASQRSSSMIEYTSTQVAFTSASFFLKKNSGYTVDVVGIYGFPGLGKTTLCKCLCDFYRAKFNGMVYYVDLQSHPTNSEQASFKKQSSFKIRMQHMLSMITGYHDHDFRYSKDDDQVQNVLRKKLSSMIDAVFLAIDNILPDRQSQKEAKFYLTDVKFPKGSKIFITSRSKNILQNLIRYSGSRSTVIEYMPALQFKEARDIFVHGFPELLESGNISNEEDELVKDWVNKCTIHRKQYHPMMIKSLLTAIITGNIEWKRESAKLSSEGINKAWRGVFNMLDIIFAKLSEEAKEIFLDLGRFYSTAARNIHDRSTSERPDYSHLSKKKKDALFRQLQDWGFFEEIEGGPRLDDLLVHFCNYKSSPGATGRAKQIEMRSAVKDLQSTESDAQSSIASESQLRSEGICVTSCSPSIVSPTDCIDKGKNADGIQLLLLRLENTPGSIDDFDVGIKVHAKASQMLEHVSPSKVLECYFFNPEHMAFCVGVGLPHAKVILYDDLSVTVEETGVSDHETELKETWMPLKSDNSRHLVMKMNMEDDHVQAEKHEYSTPSQYGVSLDCGLQLYVEKYDETKLSRPVLYEMALFVLRTNAPQCNKTNSQFTDSGSPSSLDLGNMQNDVVEKLQGTHIPGNSQGERGDGDGDGDEVDGNPNVSELNGPGLDKFRVTMYPQRKDDILGLQEKPKGLDEANIVPKLVFEFQKQGNSHKRLSIQLELQLEIVSTTDVGDDTNVFGWYHNNIKMSFGCENINGQEQSAQLEPGSARMLNDIITSSKDAAVKSSTSTVRSTLTANATGGINVLGTGVQGSVSSAQMEQEAANYGHTTEMPREYTCKGFSYQNSSAGARARFSLLYPLSNLNIWDNSCRESLHGQGLLSTITPHMQGVWMRLDDITVSPYSLEVERSLNLHEKSDSGRLTKVNHTQRYRLPFYINHAMTHLRNQIKNELHGNQDSIRNVIEVGTVNLIQTSV